MRPVMFLFAGLLMFAFAGCEEIEMPDIDNERPRVAVLTADGFHDGETIAPFTYLKTRGADVCVVGMEREEIKAYNSDITIFVEKTVAEVSGGDFDAVVIPGGRAPGRLREDEGVLEFVREAYEGGRILAGICHGPQVLVSAGVLGGKTATCVGGIADELKEAGVDYRDEEVVRDGDIITSRVPGDIPSFNRTIGDALFE